MKHRRAFTLVELMAVIGIIVVLMAILIPSINRAITTARRTKQAGDLQSVAAALTAYFQDFRSYPPVYKDGEGPLALSRALIAPEPAWLPPPAPGEPPGGDSQDGPGFRTRRTFNNVPQGSVYGPYLNIDHFHTAPAPGYEILDIRNQPILYYPLHKQAMNSKTPDRYLNTFSHATPPGSGFPPYINAADNWSPSDPSRQYMNPAKLDLYFGIDRAGNKFTRNVPNGGDYILWSSGPDEQFGPLDPNHPEKCDDVNTLPPTH